MIDSIKMSGHTPTTISLDDREEENHSHPITEIDTERLSDEYKIAVINVYERTTVSVYTGELKPRFEVPTDGINNDGTDVVGRVVIYQIGNRAHLWHLKTKEDHRGCGIGSFLMDVFEEYVRNAETVEKVSGQILNRGGAKSFLQSRGISPSVIDVVSIPYRDVESVVFGSGSTEADINSSGSWEEFDGWSAAQYLS